jgi:hypothetical protein
VPESTPPPVARPPRNPRRCAARLGRPGSTRRAPRPADRSQPGLGLRLGSDPASRPWGYNSAGARGETLSPVMRPPALVTGVTIHAPRRPFLPGRSAKFLSFSAEPAGFDPLLGIRPETTICWSRRGLRALGPAPHAAGAHLTGCPRAAPETRRSPSSDARPPWWRRCAARARRRTGGQAASAPARAGTAPGSGRPSARPCSR